MKPPIIAIEGDDKHGCLKQLNYIKESLSKNGYRVATFSFPNSKNGSSYFIKEYENGQYKNNLNPYAVSTFYALDRFDTQDLLTDALTKNDVVLINNYIGATMAKLGQSFTNNQQLKSFLVWLDGFETELYGNMRPNHSFVINTKGLQSLSSGYQALCNNFPKDFSFVGLSSYTDDKILKSLLQTIKPFSYSEKAKQNNTKNHCTLYDLLRSPTPPNNYKISKEYKDIEGLNKNQQNLYRQTIIELSKIRNKIVNDIPKNYITKTNDYLSLLGASVNYSGDKFINSKVKKGQFDHSLHDNIVFKHSSGISIGAELSNVTPRNQMSIINDILYAVTDLNYQQIIEQTNKMSYDAKTDLIKKYIADGHSTGLANIVYNFNIGASLQDILWIKQALKKELVIIQSPSPRNGYDIPKYLAKHSHIIETYFDYLNDLHNKLSNTNASKYLVALGNIANAKLKLSYLDIINLSNYKQLPEVVKDIINQTKQTHPIIFE
jgi:thymidylate kinase